MPLPPTEVLMRHDYDGLCAEAHSCPPMWSSRDHGWETRCGELGPVMSGKQSRIYAMYASLPRSCATSSLNRETGRC